jgi:hypothetical protein
MNYDQVFALYRDGAESLDALITLLRPCVRSWAGDVLRTTSQAENPNWRDELISAGLIAIYRQLTKRSKPFRSGRHIVNRLRLTVKKAMRKAYGKLFIGPIIADHELLGQTAKCGERAMLFPICGRSTSERGGHQDVEIDWDNVETSLPRHAGSNDPFGAAIVDSIIDPDSDGRLTRMFQLCELVAEAACCEAQHRGWEFVETMRSLGLSVSEIARRMGVPRSTVRYRLRSLGPAIAASADEGLDELGREFLGPVWVAAAAKGQKSARRQPRRVLPRRFTVRGPAILGKSFLIYATRKVLLGHRKEGGTQVPPTGIQFVVPR